MKSFVVAEKEGTLDQLKTEREENIKKKKEGMLSKKTPIPNAIFFPFWLII